MRKSNKDFLYRCIFKLFLSKHYELVTIRDIEEATGMTRGAVFYYAPNKLQLFCEVVDTYFFKAHAPEEKLKEWKDKVQEQSLLEFIHSYVQAMDQRMIKLQSILDMEKAEALRAYVSFVLQAENYYPGFNEKMTSIFDAEMQIWQEVLSLAQQKGEIKENIDVSYFARIFCCFYVGLCYQTSLNQGFNPAELEIYLMSMYMTIKR